MSNKSFTLIELLVVIAIIGLLVIIIAIPINRARRGASIARTLQYEASLHRYLGADIVGWWKLDGDLTDISGNDNHGIWGGSGETQYLDGIHGKEGYALKFNGIGDYVNLTGLGLNNPETYGGSYGQSTISLWLKSYEEEESNGFAMYMAGFHYFQIRGSNNQFRLRLMVRNISENVNYWPVSIASILPNKWTHIVFVIEGKVGVRFYINGDLDNDISHTGIGISSWGSNSAIGSIYNDYFNGLISDVRIYSRALTSEEIQTIYAETKDKYIVKN